MAINRRSKPQVQNAPSAPYQGNDWETLLSRGYIGLDLETTAFDPDTGEIIQVGAVKYDAQGKPTGEKIDLLVRPKKGLSKEIQDLTGIKPDQFGVLPTIEQEELSGTVKNFVGDLPIMAYNADFDVGYLKAKGIDLTANDVIDPMRMHQAMFPKFRNRGKLPQVTDKKNRWFGGLARQYDINRHGSAHSAISDVDVTNQYFWAMLTETRSNPAKYADALGPNPVAGLFHARLPESRAPQALQPPKPPKQAGGPPPGIISPPGNGGPPPPSNTPPPVPASNKPRRFYIGAGEKHEDIAEYLKAGFQAEGAEEGEYQISTIPLDDDRDAVRLVVEHTKAAKDEQRYFWADVRWGAEVGNPYNPMGRAIEYVYPSGHRQSVGTQVEEITDEETGKKEIQPLPIYQMNARIIRRVMALGGSKDRTPVQWLPTILSRGDEEAGIAPRYRDREKEVAGGYVGVPGFASQFMQRALGSAIPVLVPKGEDRYGGFLDKVQQEMEEGIHAGRKLMGYVLRREGGSPHLILGGTNAREVDAAPEDPGKDIRRTIVMSRSTGMKEAKTKNLHGGREEAVPLDFEGNPMRVDPNGLYRELNAIYPWQEANAPPERVVYSEGLITSTPYHPGAMIVDPDAMPGLGGFAVETRKAIPIELISEESPVNARNIDKLKFDFGNLIGRTFSAGTGAANLGRITYTQDDEEISEDLIMPLHAHDAKVQGATLNLPMYYNRLSKEFRAFRPEKDAGDWVETRKAPFYKPLQQQLRRQGVDLSATAGDSAHLLLDYQLDSAAAFKGLFGFKTGITPLMGGHLNVAIGDTNPIQKQLGMMTQESKQIAMSFAGAFGTLDTRKQAAMFLRLPDKKVGKQMARYINDTYRKQKRMVDIEDIAEQYSTLSGRDTSWLEMFGELYDTFTDPNADAKKDYRQFGIAAIRTPQWIYSGMMSGGELSQYQKAAEPIVRSALQERLGREATREEYDQELGNYFRWTPTDIKGQTYYKTQFKMDKGVVMPFALHLAPEWHGGFSANVKQMASMTMMFPEEARVLGLHLQDSPALGNRPSDSTKAWAEMAQWYSYDLSKTSGYAPVSAPSFAKVIDREAAGNILAYLGSDWSNMNDRAAMAKLQEAYEKFVPEYSEKDWLYFTGNQTMLPSMWAERNIDVFSEVAGESGPKTAVSYRATTLKMLQASQAMDSEAIVEANRAMAGFRGLMRTDFSGEGTLKNITTREVPGGISGRYQILHELNPGEVYLPQKQLRRMLQMAGLNRQQIADVRERIKQEGYMPAFTGRQPDLSRMFGMNPARIITEDILKQRGLDVPSSSYATMYWSSIFSRLGVGDEDDDLSYLTPVLNLEYDSEGAVSKWDFFESQNAKNFQTQYGVAEKALQGMFTEQGEAYDIMKSTMTEYFVASGMAEMQNDPTRQRQDVPEKGPLSTRGEIGRRDLRKFMEGMRQYAGTKWGMGTSYNARRWLTAAQASSDMMSGEAFTEKVYDPMTRLYQKYLDRQLTESTAIENVFKTARFYRVGKEGESWRLGFNASGSDSAAEELANKFAGDDPFPWMSTQGTYDDPNSRVTLKALTMELGASQNITDSMLAYMFAPNEKAGATNLKRLEAVRSRVMESEKARVLAEGGKWEGISKEAKTNRAAAEQMYIRQRGLSLIQRDEALDQIAGGPAQISEDSLMYRSFMTSAIMRTWDAQDKKSGGLVRELSEDVLKTLQIPYLGKRQGLLDWMNDPQTKLTAFTYAMQTLGSDWLDDAERPMLAAHTVASMMGTLKDVYKGNEKAMGPEASWMLNLTRTLMGEELSNSIWKGDKRPWFQTVISNEQARVAEFVRTMQGASLATPASMHVSELAMYADPSGGKEYSGQYNALEKIAIKRRFRGGLAGGLSADQTIDALFGSITEENIQKGKIAEAQYMAKQLAREPGEWHQVGERSDENTYKFNAFGFNMAGTPDFLGYQEGKFYIREMKASDTVRPYAENQAAIYGYSLNMLAQQALKNESSYGILSNQLRNWGFETDKHREIIEAMADPNRIIAQVVSAQIDPSGEAKYRAPQTIDIGKVISERVEPRARKLEEQLDIYQGLPGVAKRIGALAKGKGLRVNQLISELSGIKPGRGGNGRGGDEPPPTVGGTAQAEPPQRGGGGWNLEALGKTMFDAMSRALKDNQKSGGFPDRARYEQQATTDVNSALQQASLLLADPELPKLIQTLESTLRPLVPQMVEDLPQGVAINAELQAEGYHTLTQAFYASVLGDMPTLSGRTMSAIAPYIRKIDKYGKQFEKLQKVLGDRRKLQYANVDPSKDPLAQMAITGIMNPESRTQQALSALAQIRKTALGASGMTIGQFEKQYMRSAKDWQIAQGLGLGEEIERGGFNERFKEAVGYDVGTLIGPTEGTDRRGAVEAARTELQAVRAEAAGDTRMQRLMSLWQGRSGQPGAGKYLTEWNERAQAYLGRGMEAVKDLSDQELVHLLTPENQTAWNESKDITPGTGASVDYAARELIRRGVSRGTGQVTPISEGPTITMEQRQQAHDALIKAASESPEIRDVLYSSKVQVKAARKENRLDQLPESVRKYGELAEGTADLKLSDAKVKQYGFLHGEGLEEYSAKLETAFRKLTETTEKLNSAKGAERTKLEKQARREGLELEELELGAEHDRILAQLAQGRAPGGKWDSPGQEQDLVEKEIKTRVALQKNQRRQLETQLEDKGFGDFGEAARGLLGGWGLFYMSHLIGLGRGEFAKGYEARVSSAQTIYGAAGSAFGPGVGIYESPEIASRRAEARGGGLVYRQMREIEAGFSGTPISDLAGAGLTGLGVGTLLGYVGENLMRSKGWLGRRGQDLTAAAPYLGLLAGVGTIAATQAAYSANPEETTALAAQNLSRAWTEGNKGNKLQEFLSRFSYGNKMLFLPQERREEAEKLAFQATMFNAGQMPASLQPGQLPAFVGAVMANPIYDKYPDELIAPIIARYAQAGIAGEPVTRAADFATYGIDTAKFSAQRMMLTGQGVPTIPELTRAEERLLAPRFQKYSVDTGAIKIDTTKPTSYLPEQLEYMQAGLSLYENIPDAYRILQGEWGTDQKLEELGRTVAGTPGEAAWTLMAGNYALGQKLGIEGFAMPEMKNKYTRDEYLTALQGNYNLTNADQLQAALATQFGMSAQQAQDYSKTHFGAEGQWKATRTMGLAQAMGQWMAPTPAFEFATGVEALGVQGFNQFSQLASFSPMAWTNLALKTGMPEAQMLATSDINMRGIVTGQPLFTSSMQWGDRSGEEMARRIWGPNWAGKGPIMPTGTGQNVGMLSGMVNGITLPFTNPVTAQPMVVGGMQAANWMQMQLGFQHQMSSFGIQREQLALQEQQMGKSNALQEQLRQLGYRQTEWGFEYSQKQMALQQSQFAENMAMNWKQMQTTRQFAKEDWGFQDMTRGLQWGWRQEDYQEQARFMTGRDRRLADRQMQRETTMHNLESENIDRQRKQQEELWQMEDERFNLQKKQYSEQQKLQEENLKKQREFFEERKRLETEAAKLNKEYGEKSLEIAKKQLAANEEYAIKQQEIQKLMFALTLIQSEIQTNAQSIETGQSDSIKLNDEFWKKVKEYLGDLISDVPKDAGGSGGDGKKETTPPKPPSKYEPTSIPMPKPGSNMPINDIFLPDLPSKPNNKSSGAGSINMTINIGNERLKKFILKLLDQELEIH